MTDHRPVPDAVRAALARNRLLHDILDEDHPVSLAIQARCRGELRRRRQRMTAWRIAVAAGFMLAISAGISGVLTPSPPVALALRTPASPTPKTSPLAHPPAQVFQQVTTAQVPTGLVVIRSSTFDLPANQPVLLTYVTSGSMAGSYQRLHSWEMDPRLSPMDDTELLRSPGVLALVDAGRGNKRLVVGISPRSPTAAATPYR